MRVGLPTTLRHAGLGQYLPNGQVWQSVAAVAPLLGPNVPAGQSVHATSVEAAVKVPTPQHTPAP